MAKLEFLSMAFMDLWVHGEDNDFEIVMMPSALDALRCSHAGFDQSELRLL